MRVRVSVRVRVKGRVRVYTTRVGSLRLCYDAKSNNNVTAIGRSLFRWETEAQPSEGKKQLFHQTPHRTPSKTINGGSHVKDLGGAGT